MDLTSDLIGEGRSPSIIDENLKKLTDGFPLKRIENVIQSTEDVKKLCEEGIEVRLVVTEDGTIKHIGGMTEKELAAKEVYEVSVRIPVSQKTRELGNAPGAGTITFKSKQLFVGGMNLINFNCKGEIGPEEFPEFSKEILKDTFAKYFENLSLNLVEKKNTALDPKPTTN